MVSTQSAVESKRVRGVMHPMQTVTIPLVLDSSDFLENACCPGCKSIARQLVSQSPEQLPHQQPHPAGMVVIADEIRCQRIVWCCDECGLWYISRIPSPQAIESLYEVLVYSEGLKPDSRRKTFDRAIAALAHYGLTHGRILDVGAHTGEFLLRLPDWERYALEPIGISRQHLNFAKDVYSGYVDTVRTLPQNCFDVVSMFDVAEHLYDVEAALRNVSACLKPGGLLLVETGNTDSRTAQTQRAWWWYVHWYGHFVFFNRRSLAYTLNRAGLELVTFTSVHHLDPTGWDVISACCRLAAYQIVSIVGTQPLRWRRLAYRHNKWGAIPSLPWKDHCFVVARKSSAAA